jgi:hypothetical protein
MEYEALFCKATQSSERQRRRLLAHYEANILRFLAMSDWQKGVKEPTLRVLERGLIIVLVLSRTVWRTGGRCFAELCSD